MEGESINFMEKYEFNEIVHEKNIREYFGGDCETIYIGTTPSGVDVYKEVGFMCRQTLEPIFEDEMYTYYLPSYESKHYALIYDDEIYSLKEALHENIVYTDDLMDLGIVVYEIEKTMY